MRGFHWGPFLPNSLHFMTCLIALTMGKTEQRGLLTLKAPGGTRMPILLIVHPSPSSTPTSQGSGLWLSCFMWLFSLQFQMPGLALHFYPVLLQERAMCNLALQLLKNTFENYFWVHRQQCNDGDNSGVPGLWPRSKPKQWTRGTEEPLILKRAAQEQSQCVLAT